MNTHKSGVMHISLEFEEIANQRIRSFCPINEEPIWVRFLKSGWDYGYPTYHVIIEYGEYSETDYRFMSAAEIKESFGIDITQEDIPHGVLVTLNQIKETTNYYDLGELVYKMANNFSPNS